jgi:hypothetical protein
VYRAYFSVVVLGYRLTAMSVFARWVKVELSKAFRDVGRDKALMFFRSIIHSERLLTPEQSDV